MLGGEALFTLSLGCILYSFAPIYLSLCKKEKILEEVFLAFLGGGDNLNKEGGGELLM